MYLLCEFITPANLLTVFNTKALSTCNTAYTWQQIHNTSELPMELVAVNMCLEVKD